MSQNQDRLLRIELETARANLARIRQHIPSTVWCQKAHPATEEHQLVELLSIAYDQARAEIRRLQLENMILWKEAKQNKEAK